MINLNRFTGILSLLLIAISLPLFGFINLKNQSISTPRGSIQLTIENIEKDKGSILVGVFKNPDTFLDRGEFIFGDAYPTNGKDSMQIVLPPIEYGTYAVGVVHDLNDNTYLDKNLFGVPTEPYGFYKNFRGKWNKPTFDDCSFVLESPSTSFSVTVSYWGDK